MQRQGEEVKQLERVKEGLLLDKDILNQLKVGCFVIISVNTAARPSKDKIDQDKPSMTKRQCVHMYSCFYCTLQLPGASLASVDS